MEVHLNTGETPKEQLFAEPLRTYLGWFVQLHWNATACFSCQIVYRINVESPVRK